MPEPDFFDECYPSFHRRRLARGRRAPRRFITWLDAVARQAIAQPAKSAVATMAFGLIVGALLRVTVLRHSGPNSVAGSVVNQADPARAVRQRPAPTPIPMTPKSSQSQPQSKADRMKPIEAGDGFDWFTPVLWETQIRE